MCVADPITCGPSSRCSNVHKYCMANNIIYDASCNPVSATYSYDVSCTAGVADGTCTPNMPIVTTMPPAPAPTATLSADPSEIDAGQFTWLEWNSTYADSCVAAGGFSTGGARSGRARTSPLTENPSTFQVTCTNATGDSATATTNVTVLHPTIEYIKASVNNIDVTRVRSADTVKILWKAYDVKRCSVSGPSIALTNLTGAQLSGSRDVQVTTQSKYTITCDTNDAPITKSLILNVTPAFQEF
jgi:hypothetical protein